MDLKSLQRVTIFRQSVCINKNRHARYLYVCKYLHTQALVGQKILGVKFEYVKNQKPISKIWVQILICPICLADTTSQTSSLESEWVVVTSPGENARGATPPPGSASIPSISLTDTNSFLQPEADEYGGGGDSDDGPEYLAIGNLGQRNDRRNSQSSTHSSERGGNTDQSLQCSTTQAPQRRSSFSEGQKGPGRGLKGHTRSFSDTGVNQKLRNGE